MLSQFHRCAKLSKLLNCYPHQHNGNGMIPFSTISTQEQERRIKKAITNNLRRLTKPFLQLCHPDKTAPQYARINLKAIQTLNGLLDTVEQSIIHNNKSTILLKSKYTIEFILPSTTSLESMNHKAKNEILVTMNFPSDCIDTIDKLKHQVEKELSKLLLAADLPVPHNLMKRKDTKSTEGVSLDTSSTTQKDDGMDILLSKKEFLSHFDLAELQRYLDRSKERHEADIATTNVMNEALKQELISNLISRIRVKKQDSTNHNNEEQDNYLIEQLVSIRRISLLLNDHFTKLQIEKYGRLYESLHIVLVPPSSIEKKRRKIFGGTGFRFSLLNSHSSDQIVTVYVPMNFQEHEFIKEFLFHIPKIAINNDEQTQSDGDNLLGSLQDYIRLKNMS